MQRCSYPEHWGDVTYISYTYAHTYISFLKVKNVYCPKALEFMGKKKFRERKKFHINEDAPSGA